jgi:putative ABC transport system permease protein
MSVFADVRYALRVLARSPIFTVTAVLSLAAGIAASAAIFSLADAALLRPRVGVADPATLVDIGRSMRGEGHDNFGYPLFAEMRERNTLLSGIAAQRLDPPVMSLGDARASERVYAGLVSGNYFEVVGTRPAAGRFFVADEDSTPGTHPIVVLSHQFWSRRFASRTDVVGQEIRLNNRPYVVIGVAERGFTGTSIIAPDFWVPMAMEAHVRAGDASLLTEHNAVWMTALGRLKPGVSIPQARDELNGIMRSYLTDHGPDRLDRWGVAVARSARVPSELSGPIVGFLAMLGILTGLVLLIACSNVAGMLLARALERRREVATRLAVGASRSRILRQLLIEGLTLALVAGGLSVPLVFVLVWVLSSYQPTLPVPIALELRIDPRVMAFAFLLATFSAIVFAVIPGLRATSFALTPALHGVHATMDRKRAWLRHGLVAGQVAMALLLLVTAALFLRSLQKAAAIEAGFNARDVDIVQIDTRVAGYRTAAEGIPVIDALTERFRLAPGVVDVGASRMIPVQGGGLGLGGLRAPGYVGPDGTDQIETDWDVVSTDYFKTLQLRLVQGRAFTATDRQGAPFVAIVNETMAATLWPGQNPIGRTLYQQTGRKEERRLEVVGVAHNAKYRSIGESPRPFIYVPLAQQFMSEVTFYIRRSAQGSRINELRQAVVAFDPMLPVIQTQTLEEATSIGLIPQRLAAWIAGGVGTLGLLLAAFGLYGLTAFSVAQRTREIAIRMALGASREGVLWMVLRQAGRLTLIGSVVGIAAAVGFSTLLGSLLIGLQPVDSVAFGAAIALLGGVMVAASWAPARRAATMDPMRALRSE